MYQKHQHGNVTFIGTVTEFLILLVDGGSGSQCRETKSLQANRPS